jgi:predicted nucleic acid-binding protein
MFKVLLDTCVLFKPLLCDTLLCIAEEGLYQPLWSEDILDELRRNLLRHGVAEIGVQHRIDQMLAHFPGSMVCDYRPLTAAMTNHHKDRHVLAAAIRGDAELIVTENIRDFPLSATKSYDIEVVDQDVFLLDQLDLASGCVYRALDRQVSRYRRAPRTIDDLLIELGRDGNGCPRFAKQCHMQRARD